MAKRLIFSDLHFGDTQCSFSKEAVTVGLRKFLRGLGHVEELILAGDILDANISSLMIAIEGKKGKKAWPRQIGFRKWLYFIFERSKFTVDRIVYVPGNHDYVVWNILSTNKAFVEPISRGQIPGDLPLMESTFAHPFIRGLSPKKFQDKFMAIYPDYEFNLGKRKALVTHGHYLDETQTLFRNLKKLVKQEGNERKPVKKFFKLTAQYQTAANAVSYVKESREFVEKAYKSISKLINTVNFIGKLRHKAIDLSMLKAIEMYLLYFRNRRPDVFIFGHTHEAGRSNTK